MNVNHQLGRILEYIDPLIFKLEIIPFYFSIQQPNQNNNNNASAINPNPALLRQPSPAAHFDTSTVDRSVKHGVLDNFNSQMQNEHAWAIERKRAGAK
jgi:hypothetical protein